MKESNVEIGARHLAWSKYILRDVIMMKRGSQLNGQQQEAVIRFFDSNNMTYQEVAKFLAPRMNVKQDDIYQFLRIHDEICQDNKIKRFNRDL